MYFSDALRAIARRWWIALIGLVLVAGGGLSAMNLVATQYQASGQVLLLPPTAPYRYKDSDPEQVLRMRDELFKVVEAQLAALQAREGVSELHSIGLRYFSVGSEAEVLAGARMRAVVLVGVLGAVLTLLVIFSVDKASRRPSSPRERESDLATSSPAAVAQPEPVRTLRRSLGIWPPPPPAGPRPHPLERGHPLAGGDVGVWGRAN